MPARNSIRRSGGSQRSARYLALNRLHVLITPHTAGETCRYEDNELSIMQENLARLWRSETELLNQVV